MTTFGSVRPGGDPKFSFSSCQKEGLGCTRDTALRRLRDLAWMRWDDAVCWEEGGAGRWLASPCIQLQPCCCTMGEEEAWLPTAVVTLLTAPCCSPDPALLWLHGYCRSQQEGAPPSTFPAPLQPLPHTAGPEEQRQEDGHLLRQREHPVWKLLTSKGTETGGAASPPLTLSPITSTPRAASA